MTDIDKIANRFALAAGLSKQDALAIVAVVKDALDDRDES